MEDYKKELTYLGFSEDEIESLYDMEIEDDESCVSRKISIFAHEFPKWKHSKVVAAAHAWCGLSKSDTINIGNLIGKSKNLSLSKFSTLIKNLKTKVGLKVGGMGLLPQKIELPMKNLNRLQTKLEKLHTEEQKWLTEEQLAQRTQYARYMRKTDTEEVGNIINEIYEALEDTERKDNIWALSNEAEIVSMNDGLNNIIKAPIILAKEMVQPYENGKGELEYHFKPYDELKKAVEQLGENASLDMIIEHQDWYTVDNIMGYVKEIRTDDDDRSIKGTGYFYESKLPKGLKQMIKKGEKVDVSIGFLAKLGGSGTWNDIDYQHTQEDIILRHLAIVLESIARCPSGVCGINLGDSKDIKEGIESKLFTIIKKENYYYNICNIKKDITDSKKETNKENILSNKDEKVEPMQKDATNDENLPDDFEAVLKWIRNFVEGKVERQSLVNRILAALGVGKKSDSDMDEKEYKDTLAKTVSELEAKHKELIDSKDERIKGLEDRERIRLIKSIKSFGDKFSDEELEVKKLDSLIEIEDAVSRFAPSKEKPDVLPVAAKDDKEKMEKELKKDSERIDFSRVNDDINKDFEMDRF